LMRRHMAFVCRRRRAMRAAGGLACYRVYPWWCPHLQRQPARSTGMGRANKVVRANQEHPCIL